MGVRSDVEGHRLRLRRPDPRHRGADLPVVAGGLRRRTARSCLSTAGCRSSARSNAAFDPQHHLEERLGRALTQEVLDERVAAAHASWCSPRRSCPGVARAGGRRRRDAGLKLGVASSSTPRAGSAATSSGSASSDRFDCMRCRDDVSQRQARAGPLPGGARLPRRRRPARRSRSRIRPTACSPPRRRHVLRRHPQHDHRAASTSARPTSFSRSLAGVARLRSWPPEARRLPYFACESGS